MATVEELEQRIDNQLQDLKGKVSEVRTLSIVAAAASILSVVFSLSPTTLLTLRGDYKKLEKDLQ